MLIGQQWCKPSTYWESGGIPYGGAISIRSNAGILLLCNVEVIDGITKVTPIKETEVLTQTEVLTWI